MEALWNAGARVQAYDPVAHDETRRIYGKREELMLADNPEDALTGADALVLVTEWRIFQSPDFDKMKQRLNGHAIFDGRNVYDPDMLRDKGFTYFGIGRH